MSKKVIAWCLALAVSGIVVIALLMTLEFSIPVPEDHGRDPDWSNQYFGEDANCDSMLLGWFPIEGYEYEPAWQVSACQDARNQRIAISVILSPLIAVLGSVGVLGLYLRRSRRTTRA